MLIKTQLVDHLDLILSLISRPMMILDNFIQNNLYQKVETTNQNIFHLMSTEVDVKIAKEKGLL